ncbi:MAG: FliM/FliN family flagellar motor switch protein [Deferrisomatales bacterium]|nr:FliM/FliN family flagellar motor switch protein [Deferrisomatales bacterium]
MARVGQSPTAGRGDSPQGVRDWDALGDVPLRLAVEIGRTRTRVRDLLALRVGSLLVTHKPSGEPVEVSLNGEVFAQAEIIIFKDRLQARLTQVLGAPR